MRKTLLLVIIAAMLSGIGTASAQNSLYEGFVKPGKECYPRVWWHWMHGNVTKDGIRKDLEWMNRVGIAGVQQFNAQLNPTDVIVKERVPIFSDKWKEMFKYALDVSDSLGMEFTIASSPGWSITGGPWVSMDDAQKKLCWRTMEVKGGRKVSAPLPEPIRYSGPLQEKPQWPNDINKYLWYRDIAVLAIRTESIAQADTISHWDKRAGFTTDFTVDSQKPEIKINRAIPASDILDITAFCHNGRIDWNAPKGNWTIYRFGYNLLGRHNGPVEKGGVGLEADKLSPRAMGNYYRNYLKIMDDASGHRLGKFVKYMLIDSYEAGKGTWTDLMPEEFMARRGYDVIPWLPVLTGLPIDSAEATKNFLFDWRKTLGEMLVEYHYGLAREIAGEYGMGLYGESHEWKTAFIGDGMMPKKHYDIPMGAIWVRYGEGWYGEDYISKADIRESASVAHIYGKNICGAESFSLNSGHTYSGRYPAYQCHPGNLKRLADAAFSQGLNRFLLHCSPHQPEDSRFPGLGLGMFGNWFTRHDTWAEESGPWYDYLARNCYMLQQGTFVSDVAVFYGEDMNATGTFAKRNIPTPKGYGFDLVNADIILNELTLKNGRLYTKGGTSYKMILVDPEVKYMTKEVEEKLEYFKNRGILICRDDKAYGLLTANGIMPDCIFPSIEGTDFYHVHRQAGSTHIYWLGNISPIACDAEVSLRISGMKPMLWDAETGKVSEVSYRMEGGRTKVKLHFNADDSHIIVFEENTDVMHNDIPQLVENRQIMLTGPWKVDFQPERGAPASTVLNKLVSLSDNTEDGIRYFSGTAVYSKEFTFDAADYERVVLDLGETAVMARVKLNGKDLGLLWHAPYRVDITDSLTAGQNRLEIAVTNLWANRLIADSSKPKNERLAYTAFQYYYPHSPLPKSGLIGPVNFLFLK